MKILNERILEYSVGGFFDGRWQLDGATPEEALLGVGTYGHVYGLVNEERDLATGELQKAALKIIPIDEESLHLSREKSEAERQLALNKMLREVKDEIKVMERVQGVSTIAYFRASQIIERTDTDLNSWDVLILMDRLISFEEDQKYRTAQPGSHAYLVETLHMWKDISNALQVCESKQVIHADVKPANILYHPQLDTYELGDFGVSIPSGSFKRGISYGTIEYMSPEMYHKEGGNSRADMYSLAVMIYEMLNGGKLPFQDGANRKEASLQRLEGKKAIPPIKGVPADVNRVLRKCLERDPNQRYSSCRELEQVVLVLYAKYLKEKRWDIRKYALIGTLALCVVCAGIFGIKKLISKPTPGPATTEAIEAVNRKQEQGAGASISTEAPVMRLALDESAIVIEGTSVTVHGALAVHGEISPEELVLSINNNTVDASWEQAEGGYAFAASPEMDLDGIEELTVQVTVQGNSAIAAAKRTIPMPTAIPAASPTPTITPSSTPTATPSPTPTATPIPTPPTTPSPTPSPTPTVTPSPTPTATPSPTPTVTPSPTPTATPSPTPTITPEPTLIPVSAWPVMRNDTPEGNYWNDDGKDYTPPTVLGKDYDRFSIASIQFLNSLENAPDDAWDVSQDGNGSVLAWVIPKGEYYDLYIAGDGGVRAPESCCRLFYDYGNATRIDFNKCFDTSNVRDMSEMFNHTFSLTTLDLSDFDTANVSDMSHMFFETGLASLNLSGFNTSNVVDMSSMFEFSSGLKNLDLSSFTANSLADMSGMFSSCFGLANLNLSGFMQIPGR